MNTLKHLVGFCQAIFPTLAIIACLVGMLEETGTTRAVYMVAFIWLTLRNNQTP
jgi:hypothetical protein